jgi:hypothetical protein
MEVFFDGGCPLCAREMNWLRRRDKSHRIKFTDIHDRGFDPGDHGKPLGELMAQMHGRLPDGTWPRGVEVFRPCTTRSVVAGSLAFRDCR